MSVKNFNVIYYYTLIEQYLFIAVSFYDDYENLGKIFIISN